ncbi:uncharacterized protein TNCV_4425381 [Trichonephila clavipes]|nr:uncharacterized protein TNCV_4425381 [Trichonephila clavipes]
MRRTDSRTRNRMSETKKVMSHSLLQSGTATTLEGGSAKDGHVISQMPMTDICDHSHEGIELQLRLNSDPPLLQAPGGCYQSEPCVEGDTFVPQDDNARPHRVRIMDAFLDMEKIQRMQWPARLPDLNPIEHVWDALRRRVAALKIPFLEP